jgi:5'-nucleotidase
MARSTGPIRRAVVTAAAVVTGSAALVGFAPIAVVAQPPVAPVVVQLLALNDFHGNLEPPTGSSGTIGDVPAGTLARIKAHVADQLLMASPNYLHRYEGE